MLRELIREKWAILHMMLESIIVGLLATAVTGKLVFLWGIPFAVFLYIAFIAWLFTRRGS